LIRIERLTSTELDKSQLGIDESLGDAPFFNEEDCCMFDIGFFFLSLFEFHCLFIKNLRSFRWIPFELKAPFLFLIRQCCPFYALSSPLYISRKIFPTSPHKQSQDYQTSQKAHWQRNKQIFLMNFLFIYLIEKKQKLISWL
jgi:hypothetical protein